MIFATCIISVFSVFAHPGSLDSNGGHWDRKNGTYHFHEGKNTGGSSSSSSKTYKYEPFTPPYEPPTNNPYRENKKEVKENTSKKLSVGDVILSIVLLPFILGLFYLFFELIFVELLYWSLLEKHLPRYKINLLNEKINKFQQKQDEIFEINTKIFNLNAKYKIPDLYEIGNDNLPRDKNRTSKWGQTFTLYKTNQGAKLHVKYNCCSAVNPTHVYWHQNYTDFFKLLCKKCAKGYKPPDMSWYKCYLEYERAKEKRKNIETNYKKLHEEIETLHKKCNSLSIKMLIIFSRKNKKALQDTNKKYNELQTKSQLLS